MTVLVELGHDLRADKAGAADNYDFMTNSRVAAVDFSAAESPRRTIEFRLEVASAVWTPGSSWSTIRSVRGQLAHETLRSCLREVMPSFTKTFLRCHSTVCVLMNSCAPIS